MCACDVDSARGDFLHEELLLEMDGIFDEERPKASNLVIGYVLEYKSAKLYNRKSNVENLQAS